MLLSQTYKLLVLLIFLGLFSIASYADKSKDKELTTKDSKESYHTANFVMSLVALGGFFSAIQLNHRRADTLGWEPTRFDNALFGAAFVGMFAYAGQFIMSFVPFANNEEENSARDNLSLFSFGVQISGFFGSYLFNSNFPKIAGMGLGLLIHIGSFIGFSLAEMQ